MRNAGRIMGEESGATSIEYGLIATLIALSAMGAMLSLGNEVQDQYDDIDSKVAEANSGN